MITKEEALTALDAGMAASEIAEKALREGAETDDPRVREALAKIRVANDTLLEYALQEETMPMEARGSRFGRRGKSRHVF